MEVKNLVTFSLIIFITLLVAILGAAVFLTPDKTNTTGVVPIVNNNNVNIITAVEVAQHNTASDCWTIVSNKVYGVTKLIPTHTGGPDKIIPYCGKDATAAFDTRDGRGPHPQRAQNALNNYYVGNISR